MLGIAALALLFISALHGCTVIGSSTVDRDRLDFPTTIAQLWKPMMPLNTVSIRYGDTPIFLNVSSIVNQYSLELKIAASSEL